MNECKQNTIKHSHQTEYFSFRQVMDENDEIDLGFCDGAPDDEHVAIINDAVPVEIEPNEAHFDVESVIGYRYLNETVCICIHFAITNTLFCSN